MAQRDETLFPTGSDDFLWSLFSVLREGIFLHGADGTIREVNASASRILGIPADELIGGSAKSSTWSFVREDGSAFPVDELPVYVTLRTGRACDNVVLGLRKPDGVVQWLSLSTRSLRRKNDADRTVVTAIADVTARKMAEEAARHSALLAQASEVLASSLDYATTLQTFAELAIPRLGAWSFVDALEEDGALLRCGVAHQDPAHAALADRLRRRYPKMAGEQHGISRALQSQRTTLCSVATPETLRSVARDDEHFQCLLEVNAASYLIVPLLARGRVLGSVSFGRSDSQQPYTEDDIALAEELAKRAAIAVDNAMIHRDRVNLLARAEAARARAEWAEHRTAFLAEATESLVSSLDYSTTLERVARLSVPYLAEMAGVYIVEPNGAVRQIAAAHADPSREHLVWELTVLIPMDVSEDRVVPRVVRTGRAEMIEDLPEDMQAAWGPTPRAREIVEEELGIRSFMALPLMVRGRAIGAIALSLSADAGRKFNAGDLHLASDLVRRAGLAVENAQLYRAAQEANRLKDEFLATISHELRTPLNAILGWAHMLKNETMGPAALSKGLATIERNARAQARIVEDLLDVSRIASGKLGLEPRHTDLRQVVKDAVETTRPAAELKGIALEVSASEVEVMVLADAERLQQVVWNLLTNAVKFTPAGGRVTVKFESNGENSEIHVADTGQGVRAEFLPHLFERFRQADSSSTRSQGGLGLGLALVRNLVELHGGTVRASSDGEGKGATFVVSLPSSVKPPPSDPLRKADRRFAADGTQQARPERAVRPLEGIHVLVVDDNPDVLDLASALLEDAGAVVASASSAADALLTVERSVPDVLVSDIAMPGEDGYSLIRKLRAREATRTMPAIALTAFARPEDRRRALDAGFDVHVAKPVEPDALVAIVRNAARPVG